MSLSDEQRQFYEQTLDVTRQEIADLDQQIEAELTKVKETLKDLQKAKKAAFQMYDAACLRLGIPNDLEGTEGAPTHD
jgi:transcription termination factor NusB